MGRIQRPITAAQVMRIAHRGHPLHEPIPVLQLRNQRITLAYSDLSGQLAALIAGRDGRRDANWCTFATWSSRTIGAWISDDARDPASMARPGPAWAWSWLDRSTRYMVNRGGGASYRVLAAGNRIVFREIGLAVALFLEAFGDLRCDGPAGPDPWRWKAYLAEVDRVLDDMSRLDESWLPTVLPEPRELRLGLRQYYEALFVSDPKTRAELVLAGSILLAAYEQRRVDGYTWAVLGLFARHAVDRLVRHGSGAADGWPRRLPSRLYARVGTRCIAVSTPDEWLRIGRSLPRPPGAPPGTMFPADLDQIGSPVLAVLLEQFDRCGGDHRRRCIGDWTSFDERMSYIVNVFRSRQHVASLFAPPFPPAVEQALLDNQLPQLAGTHVSPRT